MAKINAKYNYDNDAFYEKIFKLAKQGYTDAGIAFDFDLAPETFSRMKNGKYELWNEEENRLRSERISQALTRARTEINISVRGTYLKLALGVQKNKSVTKRYVEEKCHCLGLNKQCSDCGGTGRVILTDKAVVMETESQMANPQALATWLFNHDEEWRKSTIEGKKLDITSNGDKINTGFQIEIIDKREQIEKDTDNSGL